MAEVNWNNIYKDYVTQYNDPFKAAEYTVFGRITGSKKIPTTYTQDEWYKVNAPDYFAIKTYNGTDELNNYTKTELAKPNLKFTSLRSIAQNAKGLGDGYGKNQYYTDLVEIWKQKNAAEKSFTTQSGANWWKDYGLPDPSKRFASLEEYAKTGTGDVLTQGAKYIKDSSAKYKAKLIKSGVSDAEATARTKDYAIGLGRAIDKKISSSGVTPFLVAAQQRIRSRG